MSVVALIVAVVVPVEEECVGIALLLEARQLPAVAFGGSSESLLPVYESGYPCHLQQVVLAFWGEVLQIVGHESRPKPVWRDIHHLESVCYRRFLYIDYVARFNGARRFQGHAPHAHAPFLAGIGGDGACLEHAHCPEPFVYSLFCFSHFSHCSFQCPPLGGNAMFRSLFVGCALKFEHRLVLAVEEGHGSGGQRAGAVCLLDGHYELHLIAVVTFVVCSGYCLE